jgi:hypothetical protein
VDKDLVFGKKQKQNQRIGHCGASSHVLRKKLKDLWVLRKNW